MTHGDDKDPLSGLNYFTHDFANQGLGHKFCELLMGLYFAKRNRLQYVFNEKAFIHNYRQADLQWLGDLIQQRYPVPKELKFNGQIFEMNLAQWIPVYHYHNTTSFAYAQRDEHELQEPLLGFGGRNNGYICPEDNTDPDSNCFLAKFSFFNATRDLQDLLQTGESQIERLAIHIRLGDITVSEQPETYVKVIQGMRRKLSVSLPADQIHFIYYQPPDWRDEDGRLGALQRALPGANYHNMKSVEETLRFFVASKYMMTSGSSLSYMAAYFCVHCHVVYTLPKEYHGAEMTQDNYNSYFFMDEWTPFVRYL